MFQIAARRASASSHQALSTLRRPFSASSSSSTSSSSTAAAPSPSPSFVRRHWGKLLLGAGCGVLALSALDSESSLTPSASKQSMPQRHVRGESRTNQGAASRVETPTGDVRAAVSSTTAAAAAPASSQPHLSEPSASQGDHGACRACRDGEREQNVQGLYYPLGATTPAATPADASSSSSPSSSPPSANGSCPPCYAYSHSLCPLNRAEVGRAAWAYLHTLAAYYPDVPSARQREEMERLLTLYVKHYPCGYCADRSMEQLVREPVARYVGSQAELSQWMCRLHNEVNERLGKPIFDCNFVNQRWRDGPPTGECD